MSGVIEVPLAEGGSVLVEVDDADSPVVRGMGRSGSSALPSVTEPFEEVVAGLGPITRALISQVHSIADSPSEIEIEFSVKLSAEAKLIIARTAGEANFRVALRWSHQASDPPQDGGGS